MSSTQKRMVGVAEGDWFKYGDFSVNWSSNDPNAKFPRPGREWLEDMNETEWMLMSVQNISYTSISFHTVKHFKNGTEKTKGGFVDVNTGVHNMSVIVISANLDVNDTIYTDVFSTWKVDEAILRAYLGSVRETNHMNMTLKYNITRYMDSWTINGTLYEFTNYYWDRSTGIPVEYSYEHIEQLGEYLTTLSTSYRITESNVWTVPEFPSFPLLPLFMIVTLLTVILYKRKHSI